MTGTLQQVCNRCLRPVEAFMNERRWQSFVGLCSYCAQDDCRAAIDRHNHQAAIALRVSAGFAVLAVVCVLLGLVFG